MEQLISIHENSMTLLNDKIDYLKEKLDNDLLDCEYEISKIKQKKKRLTKCCKEDIAKIEKDISMNVEIFEAMEKTFETSRLPDEEDLNDVIKII